MASMIASSDTRTQAALARLEALESDNAGVEIVDLSDDEYGSTDEEDPVGVYTRDFPDNPPQTFNYTNPVINNVTGPQFTEKSTTVKTVGYNTTVEMVLQNTVEIRKKKNTALVARESHPMHLHGCNFFVLAQGFGNYEEAMAVSQYNLLNPQEQNTVAVPTRGWAVIRFVADNSGMWFMHCHFDAHLPVVGNGF